MSNEVERFNKLLNEMKELHAEKNEMYGASYERLIDRKGLLAGYIPLENKLSRIDTLINKLNDPHLEGEKRVKIQNALEDSLADLGNYSFKFLAKYREDRALAKLPTANNLDAFKVLKPDYRDQ